MTDIVQRYGYRPVLYDEGNRSGANLIDRKVATAMLADVRNGTLRGISAPDIGRLSRDEWLTDGKVIADTLIAPTASWSHATTASSTPQGLGSRALPGPSARCRQRAPAYRQAILGRAVRAWP